MHSVPKVATKRGAVNWHTMVKAAPSETLRQSRGPRIAPQPSAAGDASPSTIASSTHTRTASTALRRASLVDGKASIDGAMMPNFTRLYLGWLHDGFGLS